MLNAKSVKCKVWVWTDLCVVPAPSLSDEAVVPGAGGAPDPHELLQAVCQ